MIPVLLEHLGWNDFFASQLSSADAGPIGRVASANHGRFLVWTADGEVDASVSGSLRKSGALWPAVGDWIILRADEAACEDEAVREGEALRENEAPREAEAVIARVLTRHTCVSRKQPEREIREQVLAANVDVLFIVSGLDRDYNPRRIERFLVMATESGARPVVLLNKADLACALDLDLAAIVADVQQLQAGLTVLPISAKADEDLDALPAQLGAGQTAALIGSSGVGKSTILNRLLGDERQRTTAVRASDSRGRHTTTTRQLFRMPGRMPGRVPGRPLLPGGWLLMDLPGLREVQLWTNAEQPAKTLEASFDDIQALAENCRFRDCTHTAEPGCAVTAAALDPARLANFQKMQRELAQLERRTNPKLVYPRLANARLAKETRAKGKAIEKSVRQHPKHGD
jgi:ribosome biogenesis GTPase